MVEIKKNVSWRNQEIGNCFSSGFLYMYMYEELVKLLLKMFVVGSIHICINFADVDF